HLFTKIVHNDHGFQIVSYDPSNNYSEKLLVSSADLVPGDSTRPLSVESYTWYPAHQKMLLFTNSKRVWRAHTRGDFWIFDVATKKLFQLGKGLPESSLQFAKI